MKLKINIIIIVLLIVAWFPLYPNTIPTKNIQNTTSVLEKKVFIDPLLNNDFYNNPDQLKDYFLTLDQNTNFDDFLKEIQSSPDLKVSQSFPQINTLRILSSWTNSRFLLEDKRVNGLWANRAVKLPEDHSSLSNNMVFYDFTKEVKAQSFIDQGFNGSNVVIAFLDTGIDVLGQINGDLDDFDDDNETEDLKVFGAVSLAPDDTLYYSDFNGRGTWHAGIACGTGYHNPLYHGIAPGASYLSVKVFDPFGIALYSTLISGVEWSISNGADIIVFSTSLPGLGDDPLTRSVNLAIDRGLFVVAPVGDEGPSFMTAGSPAGSSPKVISVGAYNSSSGKVAEFSSRGSMAFAATPDLIAPGVDLIGTRAKIIPDNSNISITTELMPQPVFGRVIDGNYSQGSGTGGAAAVVAGAIAILLNQYPLTSPELMKIALMETATPIVKDISTEGTGLIDVEKAVEFLGTYMERGVIDIFPIPSPLIYPGMVMAMDGQNITEGGETGSDWLQADEMMMFSTQAMSTGLIVMNNTPTDKNITEVVNGNFTAIHLLLSEFGLEYNETFQWFAQFEVVREFHLVTQDAIGIDGYRRYAGVLGDDSVLVSVIIESWDYYGNQSNRLHGFQLSFVIWNRSPDPINAVKIVFWGKVDLFLNDSVDDFALDDRMLFQEENGTFYAWDDINSTNYNSSYTWQAIGLRGEEKPKSWQIGPSMPLFLNLTMQEPETLTNSSEYIVGEEDPGWGAEWQVASNLSSGERADFKFQLGVGLGRNESESITNLNTQLQILEENATAEEVTDILLAKADFRRMAMQNEVYKSSVLVMNLGNTNESDVIIAFLVNRTNYENKLEVFATSEQMPLNVFDLAVVSAEWYPLFEDVYTVGWIATPVPEQTTVIPQQPEILPSNYLTRTVYIVNQDFYSNIGSRVATCFPNRLTSQYVGLFFPGEFGIFNLTFMAPCTFSDVSITVYGSGSDFVSIKQDFFDILNPFDFISLQIVIPLLAGPGLYRMTVKLVGSNNLFVEIPIEIAIRPVQGRILFDAIHNNVTIDFTNNTLVLEWDERLDTPYGNFKLVKELWNLRQPDGTSLMTLISGIEMNLTDLGFGGGEDENETDFDLRYLPDSMSGYTLPEVDVISTDELTKTILQFGDILILSDPEEPYTEAEIANITEYVNNGGVAVFWVEPEYENELASINDLLREFNLYVFEGDQGRVDLTSANWTNHKLFDNINSLQLQDPMSIKAIDPTKNQTNIIANCIATTNYGKGKVLVIGDKDLFNNTGLTKADNAVFANNIVEWGLERILPRKVVVKNPTIKSGEDIYFEIEIPNYSSSIKKDFDENGYFFIYTFVTENGTQIGGNFSMNPMWPTEEGCYVARFIGSSTNETGIIYCVFYFDQAAYAAEMFAIAFRIVPYPLETPSEFYEYPDAPYPHIWDFLILLFIISVTSLQWLYHTTKWQKRFRLFQLDKKTLYRAKTYLAEADTLIVKMGKAVEDDHSSGSELNRLRELLRIRRHLIAFFNKIKKFGDELGEV